MKTYKNKKTGAILLTQSDIGGDWELVKETKPTSKSKSKKEE